MGLSGPKILLYNDIMDQGSSRPFCMETQK
jgi:hypothetical protein